MTIEKLSFQGGEKDRDEIEAIRVGNMEAYKTGKISPMIDSKTGEPDLEKTIVFQEKPLKNVFSMTGNASEEDSVLMEKAMWGVVKKIHTDVDTLELEARRIGNVSHGKLALVVEMINAQTKVAKDLKRPDVLSELDQLGERLKKIPEIIELKKAA